MNITQDELKAALDPLERRIESLEALALHRAGNPFPNIPQPAPALEEVSPE